MGKSLELSENPSLECIVFPTATFSKGGVVCRSLQLDTDGVARCSLDDNQKPEGCVSYHKNPDREGSLFNRMIQDILDGKPITYYVEGDGENDTQDSEEVLKDLRKLNLLRYSRLAQERGLH